MCREGEATFPFQFAAIALVTNDRVLASELCVLLHVRSLKDPMIRSMNGERPFAIHELAMTEMVSAEQKTNARQLVFRTLHEMVAPQRAERTVIFGSENGVGVESLFPAC